CQAEAPLIALCRFSKPALPENITRQWIMFEAGALARGVSKDRVCTILFGVKRSDLKGPLEVRQHVEVTQDGFRKLLKTINNGTLDETDLNEMFDLVWQAQAIN